MRPVHWRLLVSLHGNLVKIIGLTGAGWWLLLRFRGKGVPAFRMKKGTPLLIRGCPCDGLGEDVLVSNRTHELSYR